MPKSAYAKAVDAIQGSLRPFLRLNGFGMRGRTFNRATDDGLTQVVSIQMGASDPPGTTYSPGLRENLHGLFAVNLGVLLFSPEPHFIRARTTDSVQRIRRFFGSADREWDQGPRSSRSRPASPGQCGRRCPCMRSQPVRFPRRRRGVDQIVVLAERERRHLCPKSTAPAARGGDSGTG